MRQFLSLVLLLTLGLLVSACGSGGDDSAAEQAALSAPPGMMAGTVAETFEAGGYTYMRLETTDGEVWVAAGLMPLSVGEAVAFDAGLPMQGYHSEALDRTFDQIYFTGRVEKLDGKSMGEAGGSDAAARSHAETPSGMGFGDVEVVDGLSVAAIHSRKDELAGEEIVFRGKVVKFTPAVMGKNWIHVQDGSGGEGSNDLTITTDTDANVGDIVLVRGMLSRDKDFGAGYAYDLIVEDAEVTVESGAGS
jgi:hypothetical protein